MLPLPARLAAARAGRFSAGRSAAGARAARTEPGSGAADLQRMGDEQTRLRAEAYSAVQVAARPPRQARQWGAPCHRAAALVRAPRRAGRRCAAARTRPDQDRVMPGHVTQAAKEARAIMEESELLRCARRHPQRSPRHFTTLSCLPVPRPGRRRPVNA